MEDFQHLTDKLTHKLMKDIGKLKAEDPNWPGKPPARMSQEDVTEEQMKAMSECEFHCPKGNFGKKIINLLPFKCSSFVYSLNKKGRSVKMKWAHVS